MDVEAEVERLYQLAPEAFVGARTDLAKRLRGAGEREGADRVARLRRPTVTAWALNQLARRDPDGLAALAEVRQALTQAQRRLLSGMKDSGLRDAMGKRREVVDRLVEETGTVLRESGRDPAPHRQAINATLEAAAVDPEAGEQLQHGRLERELPPPSGFGDVTGLELIAPEAQPSPAAGEHAQADDARAIAERKIAAAREALEAGRRRLRDLRAAAQADRDAAEDAGRRAQQSDIEATRLERRAELARRQAGADEAAARNAARDAEQAEAAAEREAEDLAHAERNLAETEAGVQSGDS